MIKPTILHKEAKRPFPLKKIRRFAITSLTSRELFIFFIQTRTILLFTRYIESIKNDLKFKVKVGRCRLADNIYNTEILGWNSSWTQWGIQMLPIKAFRVENMQKLGFILLHLRSFIFTEDSWWDPVSVVSLVGASWDGIHWCKKKRRSARSLHAERSLKSEHNR